jgi:hypothetical protein
MTEIVTRLPVVHEHRYDEAATELTGLFADIRQRDPELDPRKLLDVFIYWLRDDGLLPFGRE